MPADSDISDIFSLLKEFVGETNISTTPAQSANKFQAPIKGSLKNSGGFDPTGKGSVGRPHAGLDLRAPGGTSIFPMAPGIVKNVYNDPKGGNAVVIEHMNKMSSYYAHMGTVNVRPSDKVDYNTVIGTVGASGNAKGFPHVHWQVWRNGTLIDPATVVAIPPYTAYNPKQEKLWLPNAKEEAAKFSLNEHLKKQKSNRLI